MTTPHSTTGDVFDTLRTQTNLTKSYSEYKTERTVRFRELSDDVQTAQFLELKKKQNELRDLITQVNEARATLANLDKDYILEKESMSTELSRIKAESEIASSESRRKFISDIERLREEHKANIDRIEISLEAMPAFPLAADKESASAREDVRKFEKSVLEMKSSIAMESDEEDDVSIYHSMISNLQVQKQSLVQAIKEETSQHKSQLIELTVSLDELEETFRTEIEQEKTKLTKLDDRYKVKISSLFSELERLRVQRESLTTKRVSKLSTLESHSSDVESELRAKIRDATRVAEKLKTALLNANIRKAQQLEAERQRSSEYQNLLQENCNLKQRLFQVEKEASKARLHSSSLRNELNISIGPRRTASLFL